MRHRGFSIVETTIFEKPAGSASAPEIRWPSRLGRFIERGRSTWWCAIPHDRPYLIQAAVRGGWKIRQTGITISFKRAQWFFGSSWLADKLLDMVAGRQFIFARRLGQVLFPKSYLLSGMPRFGHDRLRVILRGDLQPARYFINRFFIGSPRIDFLGRSPFWRWKRQLLEWDAPILWAEAPAWLARLLSNRIGFAIPEIINMNVDIKSIPIATFLKKKISIKVQDILKGQDWSLKMSTDMQELFEFYYSDYMPTIRRKFDDDRYVLPFAHMRRIFQRGGLLHVKDSQGSTLGSILIVQRSGKMWLAYSSLRRGSAEVESQGVFRANIYGALLRAYEQGLTTVDMGTNHPFLTDGIILHKRMWGAEPLLQSLSNRCYWAVFDTQRPEIQALLKETPFLNFGESGLEPVIHYNPRETTRRDQLTQYQRHWMFKRVGLARFIPLPPVYPAVDRRPSFLLKPLAVWPALTKRAIRISLAIRAAISRNDVQRLYVQNPSRPAKELKEWQRNQLLDFLEHAKATVPHYESVLAGFDRSTFSMEWFRSLPLMNRKDVAASPKRYFSRVDFPVSTHVHTSGTTGNPITVKVEAKAIEIRETSQRRGRAWWGLTRGERFVKLSGRLEPIGWRRHRWDRWIENTLYVDAYKLTGKQGFDFYVRLLRQPQSFVYGYASALSELARYWFERGWTVPSGWLKAVILTGDMVSAQQKALIEAIFGAPTILEYGCTEFHVIAMECPDGGWHLETDRLVVEIVDEKGRLVAPFTPGHVVITGFDARAMPLIRYPLGDMASYSNRPCTCGRSLPLLHEVIGRENDYIELPSGGRAPGLAMSTVLESAYANINQPILPWRAIQKSPELIAVVLTDKNKNQALENSIQSELCKLDPCFKAQFEYVVSLQWREGQKRARFVSEIKTQAAVR